MEILSGPFNTLLECLKLEKEEHLRKFSATDKISLTQLKKDGLLIQPIRIINRNYGFADYPEIRISIPYFSGNNSFRDGMSLEVFSDEGNTRAVLLSNEGNQMQIRLYSSDFPDWIEDKNVGVRIVPDTYTFSKMEESVNVIPETKELTQLFNQLHGDTTASVEPTTKEAKKILTFYNEGLNSSQRTAVEHSFNDEKIKIIHGPPGTGKTTTLIEIVRQHVTNGKKVLVAAPSNAAVDHFAISLIPTKIPFLRVGNQTKMHDRVLPYTLEGAIKDSKMEKTLKTLKIKAEELRKMSFQYKRNFGKDERNQRNLLRKEVKNIQHEIRDLLKHFENTLIEDAKVILGTPIGLLDDRLSNESFDLLIIDEAGQCLEPLAWTVIPLAKNIILAGDPFQLPPTVLSEQAAKQGFNISILERAISTFQDVSFLNVQYRMPAQIANFSNEYFYKQQLLTAEHLSLENHHLEFYDTAGADFEEESEEQGSSYINKQELDIVLKLIAQSKAPLNEIAFISPYSGQIVLSKEVLPKEIRKSTIDSFQGQEMREIYLSCVRSNREGKIGFLMDYRRMNVALTRAKDKLVIIGDSSTLGTDPFYSALLTYCEQNHAYHSVWELLY